MDILRSVRASAPEILGATVVNNDGFIVASQLPTEVDESLVGGISAAVLALGGRVSSELLRAPLEQTYVRCATGYLIVNPIDAGSALVLLCAREAKLGMILMDLRRTVGELNKVL